MKHARAFSLIELLVALAVFAALAAAAYGGLAAIARTRGALAAQQDRFAALTRAVSTFERDLRQAVGRSVLDNGGHPSAAFLGSAEAVEFTRLGFANPLAEPRSNLERVVFALDGNTLRLGRYAVLDRAPDSAPVMRDLLVRAGALHLRYFGCDQVWRDAWPPSQQPACTQGVDSNAQLPRAVEFRIEPPDFGEIRRVVELPSSPPMVASPASSGGGQ
jgi:general secretion pathway protein J